MKKGFFTSSSFRNKEKIPTTARCGLCKLYKNCKSPKMPPTGKGRRKILFIAEAPGEEEDKQNIQLVGRSGRLLRRYLKKMDIDLDRDCWKTNAIICYQKGNPTPDDDMIKACRPNLMKAIKEYQPNVIVLLGKVAIKSLISVLWKEDDGTVSKWAGYNIPCHNPNAWIIPTFHPSYLLRKNDKVLNRLFRRHLKTAIQKSKSKPWKTIPDYKSQIDIIMNPIQAAKEVKEMISKGGPIAFDYETNCLKPEGEGTKIICCSICWRGKKTIAFPWQGKDIKQAISRLTLKSSIPKIASNIKFEDRWTRVKMGHPVKDWCWDTMIAAHVLDNSPGVTSLKFQSFVLLGAESYNDHIEPFLKPKGKNRFNRIHEIDLRDLLLYNGLDSLHAFHVAQKQMKLFRRVKNQ